jgi:hypothetical protein
LQRLARFQRLQRRQVERQIGARNEQPAGRGPGERLVDAGGEHAVRRAGIGPRRLREHHGVVGEELPQAADHAGNLPDREGPAAGGALPDLDHGVAQRRAAFEDRRSAERDVAEVADIQAEGEAALGRSGEAGLEPRPAPPPRPRNENGVGFAPGVHLIGDAQGHQAGRVERGGIGHVGAQGDDRGQAMRLYVQLAFVGDRKFARDAAADVESIERNTGVLLVRLSADEFDGQGHFDFSIERRMNVNSRRPRRPVHRRSPKIG